MRNLQNMQVTLLDPNIQSQRELHDLSKRLARGLPGLTGNSLLLLRLGVPTPSAGIVFPRELQKQMNVQLYLDATPGKHFIRHKRPSTGADDNVGNDRSANGPIYRLWIARTPVPQKHAIIDRLNL
ncbi:hypothetical protein [Salinibacter ruber]|uniref:hypothetical protein n=1 Tax=Salinibacter ruber TaxID=146919 RepID=UPI002167A377|nr:hypothetical protein [Salinibacter ruber]MCS3782692.1 hypothetical protein [Salinibacter ruber]